MHLDRLAFLFIFTTALAAPASCTPGINWRPCNVSGGVLPEQCGNIRVPLDYTDKTSNATIRLDLQRVVARKGPKKGSILLNFGGPGSNGTGIGGDFGAFAPNIQASSGDVYDLINVVPRGTGTNEVEFACYPDEASRQTGLQLIAGNSSDVAVGTGWARSTLFANTCAVAQNLTGDLISTAFVARDLMQVVDALDEDGMLRFWGVSYGSLLGATAVAMFPDRVDKVVLDGVVNPFEYYSNTESELFDSTDDVFRGFCKACIDNPESCALAQNQTAKQLEKSIVSLFDSLKFNPLPVPNPTAPGGGALLDYSTLKLIVWRLLYAPHFWPDLALLLARVVAGDVGGFGISIDAVRATEPQFGIKCGDVVTPNTNLTETIPILDARHERSLIFGDTADQLVSSCAQWTLKAKESYEGDFKVKTKNPVLIIGNTFDPITPITSARNLSQALEGSVVLEQNGYGHDSLIQASLCTAKNVRSYFINGTLPEKDTVCDVSVPLFSGTIGWEVVIPKLRAMA